MKNLTTFIFSIMCLISIAQNTRIDQVSIMGRSKQTVVTNANGNAVYIATNTVSPDKMTITEIDIANNNIINSTTLSVNGSLKPTAVIIDAQTNDYIVVGSYEAFASPNTIVPFMARFDVGLNNLWIASLSSINGNTSDKTPIAIQPTPNNNIYVILNIVNGGNNTDHFSLISVDLNMSFPLIPIEIEVEDPNNSALYPTSMTPINNGNELVIAGRHSGTGGYQPPFLMSFNSQTLSVINDLVTYSGLGNVEGVSNVLELPNANGVTLGCIVMDYPQGTYCNPEMGITLFSVESSTGFTTFASTPAVISHEDAHHVSANIEIAYNINQDIVAGFTTMSLCNGLVYYPTFATVDQAWNPVDCYSYSDWNETKAHFLSLDRLDTDGKAFVVHAQDNTFPNKPFTRIIGTNEIGISNCVRRRSLFSEPRIYGATLNGSIITDQENIGELLTNGSQFILPGFMSCANQRIKTPINTSDIIYPNPTNSVLNINCNLLGNWAKEVIMLGLDGKRIFNQQIGEEDIMVLNLEKLPNGVYQLLIKGDNKQETHRFIKF